MDLQNLNNLGVKVGEMVTVSDDAGQITATLDRYDGSIRSGDT